MSNLGLGPYSKGVPRYWITFCSFQTYFRVHFTRQQQRPKDDHDAWLKILTNFSGALHLPHHYNGNSDNL